eukprot:scpid105130/ scgid11806/ 
MDSAKAKLGMGRQKLAADGSPRPPPKRPRFPAADVIIDGVNDDDSPPSTLLFGATPLPDAELVINEQGKLDRLKIQSTSQVFEQYIMNKFSKLSEKAMLHECTEYANTGMASCQQRIDCANTINKEAKRDMDDVVTTLMDDKQGADFANMILYRYDYVQNLKCASSIVKNLRLSKIAKRKTPPKQLVNVTDPVTFGGIPVAKTETLKLL